MGWQITCYPMCIPYEDGPRRNIMARKRPQLVSGEIYHVVIRGVEGRELFIDNRDFYRAVHDLYEFNDSAPAGWEFRHSYLKKAGEESRFVKIEANRERDQIVDVLAFCIMPNHVHLLLRQLQADGITKFMRKLGTGYAVYFNNKYERKGVLFQGRFKAIRIKTDAQLRIAFVYIHTNPVALVESGWKEKGIRNQERAIKTSEQYKWSSYSDYLNVKNFPSVINQDLFRQMMSPKEWQNFVKQWIENKVELNFENVELE